MPPKNLPFPPMEAELVDELPHGEWQYEPKWDGFRGVLENLGGGLRLWSRNARPLLRYFPELEEKAKRFQLSPVSRDRAQAETWLVRLAQAGLDGVVAKRLGVPYLPGSRDGVVKVKPYRTADCVIVGFRWSDKADGRISTLLLGLYDDNGELDFVGHCSGFPAPIRRELEEKLPKMVAKGKLSDKRIPGGQSRWSQGRELDWNPVRPKLVVEVRYDKLERNRFRHGTRFLRFRPDKDPKDCTRREVRPPRRARDLTVPKLLTAR